MTIDPAEWNQRMEELRVLSNRQVEAFDRIQQLEERLTGLVERLRSCEARVGALEKSPTYRPSRP